MIPHGAPAAPRDGDRALMRQASATLPRVEVPPDGVDPPRDLDAAGAELLVGVVADPPDDEAYDRPPPPPEPHRSRYGPAVLDALIPGLGHLVAGRRLRAALFVSPLLVMVVTGVLARGDHVAPAAGGHAALGPGDLGPARGPGLLLAGAPDRRRVEPVRPGAPATWAPAICCRSRSCSPSWSRHRRLPATPPRSPERPPTRSSSSRHRPRPTRRRSRSRTRASSRRPAEPIDVAIGRPDRRSDHRADHRRRLRGRAQHLPDRHDDRGLARSGRPGPSPCSPFRATWSTSRCPTAASIATRSTRWCRMRAITRPSSRAPTGPGSTC